MNSTGLQAFLPSLWRLLRRSLAAAARVRGSALVNGAAAGCGVALVALAGAPLAGPFDGVLMAGAICASVPDSPSTLTDKLKRMGLAWGLGAIAVLISALASGHRLWQAIAALAIGFVAAMVTAYGRSAIPVGVSIILALGLVGASQPPGADLRAVVGWFVAGGLGYALFAVATTLLLARQTKNLLLQETLQALAAYLRAQKQALDEGGEPRRIYARLIDAQAVLAERIQAARNVIFLDLHAPADLQAAAELLVAIDVLEAAFSAQADLDTLLELRLRDDMPMEAVRGLLLLAASDLDRLARSVRMAGWRLAVPIADRGPLLDRLKAVPRGAVGGQGHALHATADKLDVLFTQLDRLRDTQGDPALGRAVIGAIDLSPFVQRFSLDPRAIAREFHLRSPVLRYAVRLSLAMCCGSAVGALLPDSAHGSWILLTVALVMRASYSVTRQRRRERLFGNVIGCLLAPLLLTIAPDGVARLLTFVAAGAAHAFAAQSYLVASVASCVMALMQLHLTAPGTDALFILRIVDTAIGGLLAYGFSYLLPQWEHQTIGRAVRDLLQAQRDCARHALAPQGADQAYRLTRRRMFDALSNLSSAVSRMLEEPEAAGYRTRTLSEFLAASYVFAAELASVQVFLHSRAEAGDARLRRAIERTAALVQTRFGRETGPEEAAADLPIQLPEIDTLDPESYAGAGVLARRLRRVIGVAGRVRRLGDLAQRPQF